MGDEQFRQQFLRLRSRRDGAWLVPPELNPKLVEDAKADGTSRNEVVVRILSAAYRVPFTPVDRKGAPPSPDPSVDSGEINLRLPLTLYMAISMAAGAAARSVPREILVRLCAHYGLRMPEKRSTPRAPRRARAAAA